MNSRVARVRTFTARGWRWLRRKLGAARRRALRLREAPAVIMNRTEPGRARALWYLDSLRGRRGLFRVQTLAGTPDLKAIPVVMCLWNRPQRIDAILSQLDAQSDPRPVRLLLWNNKAANDNLYRARIAAYQRRGSLASVEYVNSGRNVGGLARFFLAGRLLRSGYFGHFIMLDDDQDVTASFTSSLLRCAKTREIAGWWAYNYIDSHWNRTETEPGQVADYAGTGGSICDIEIVRDRTFFTRLPQRFGFLEDQWMCSYAKSRGWAVRKAEVDITFVLHESNQFILMADLKNEFRDYLMRTRLSTKAR